VALTALNGTVEKMYAVEGLSSDLCYIKIKNVVSETLASNVRLLCQGEARLHNVMVDGVEDISGQSNHLLTHGDSGVKVNDTRLYGSRPVTEDDMYNIVIKNVRSRAHYALSLAGKKIKNFSYENIVCFDGGGFINDLRELD
ncbi:MAG: hypothetical protein IKW02_03870, partial [Clostridia bacterium]|nr:hypothetical protein [Clostridia bacterium]